MEKSQNIVNKEALKLLNLRRCRPIEWQSTVLC